MEARILSTQILAQISSLKASNKSTVAPLQACRVQKLVQVASHRLRTVCLTLRELKEVLTIPTLVWNTLKAPRLRRRPNYNHASLPHLTIHRKLLLIRLVRVKRMVTVAAITMQRCTTTQLMFHLLTTMRDPIQPWLTILIQTPILIMWVIDPLQVLVITQMLLD